MWRLSLCPPPTSKAFPLVSSAGSSSSPHYLKAGGHMPYGMAKKVKQNKQIKTEIVTD